MIFQEEILVRPAQATSPNTTVDILNYQPKILTEKILGDFYLLFQYSSSKENFSSLPNLINSVLKRTFYKDFQKETAVAFRDALDETNRLIAGFFTQTGQMEMFKNLSYTFLIRKKSRLFLAQSGPNLAHLVRQNKPQDLVDKMAPAPHKIDPENFFASTLDFKLSFGDRLFLATPALGKIINPRGLAQILNENKPENISARINDLNRQQKKPVSLAALILAHRQKKNVTPTDAGKRYITPPIDLWQILR